MQISYLPQSDWGPDEINCISLSDEFEVFRGLVESRVKTENPFFNFALEGMIIKEILKFHKTSYLETNKSISSQPAWNSLWIQTSPGNYMYKILLKKKKKTATAIHVIHVLKTRFN